MYNKYVETKYLLTGVCYIYFNILSGIGIMVFNATFNNISAILWQSVLLVEETRVPVENYRLAASHWQTLSHNVVHLAWAGFKLATLVVIGTDCISSCIKCCISRCAWYTLIFWMLIASVSKQVYRKITTEELVIINVRKITTEELVIINVYLVILFTNRILFNFIVSIHRLMWVSEEYFNYTIARKSYLL